MGDEEDIAELGSVAAAVGDKAGAVSCFFGTVPEEEITLGMELEAFFEYE